MNLSGTRSALGAHPFGRTRRTLLLLALTLLWCGSSLPASAEELPSLQDLVKTKEKTEGEGEAEVEQPKFPRKLTVQEGNLEATMLLPADPILLVELPNGQAFDQAFSQSAISEFLANKRSADFLKDNQLNLPTLFSDLPSSYTNPDGIELLLAAQSFVKAFLTTPRTVTLAVYRQAGQGLTAVFLADIGRDREEPFAVLEATRDAFLEKSPNFTLQENTHGDDFIDLLRSGDNESELAFGMIRNFLVVSTSARFAQELAALAPQGANPDALAKSPLYTDIGTYTDSKAHCRGFMDLQRMLSSLKENGLPRAEETMNLLCDLLGSGRPGTAGAPSLVYYDLRAEGSQIIEHAVHPTRVADSDVPGLPARLAAVCRPAESLGDGVDWISPRMIPYQPDIFLAAQTEPAALVDLLTMKGETHFGGSPYARELSATLPDALTAAMEMLKPQVNDALTGEIGLALLPGGTDAGRNWVIVLGLRSASTAERLFASNKPVAESSGVKVHCLAKEWQKTPCWGIFNQATFKHLKGTFRQITGSCLVFSSSGILIQDLIDQVVALSSLADNRDFTLPAKELAEDHSLIWYINTPGIFGREYVDLPQILKTYFPRLTGVSNLPPMSLVNKYNVGVIGGVKVQKGQAYCRSTILGPTPVLPTLATLMTLKFPNWVRERARSQQADSRAHLGKIWLALQNYATQRIHFPETYRDMVDLFPKGEERDDLFTVSAALDQVGVEAKGNSYRYVAGLRASDEADLPIVYEAEAWHWEYAGMFPPAGVEPRETGPYQPYRLVLRLDGSIQALDDLSFKKTVLKRLRSRE